MHADMLLSVRAPRMWFINL